MHVGNLSNLDISTLNNLSKLTIYSNLENIDLSNNKELSELHIHVTALKSLDLSSNSKLESLALSGVMKIAISHVGDTVKVSDYIKLPDGFNFQYKVNSDIVTIEDDIITANKIGTTSVFFEYDGKDNGFLDSNITVLNDKVDIENLNNDKVETQDKNIDNPKTGVYTGSFIVILASAIGISIIRKFNNVKKI